MTVLVTFFSYVLPHGSILILNSFNFSRTLAGILSPYAWAVSNINSIVNIFIFGTQINDIRVVLKAYLCCRKPHAIAPSVATRPKPAPNNETGQLAAPQQACPSNQGVFVSQKAKCSACAAEITTDHH